MNINRTQEFAGSITKVSGIAHVQGGLLLRAQLQGAEHGRQPRSRARSTSASTRTTRSIRTFPFCQRRARHLLDLRPESQFIEGNFHYDNIEWYIQDNWKVNPQLTLDYGMRFVHEGPYVDKLQQVSNFFPDQWNASQGAVPLRGRAASAA